MNRNDLDINILLHGLTIETKSTNTSVLIKLVGTCVTLEGEEKLVVEKTTSNGKTINRKMGLVDNLEEIRKLFPRNFDEKKLSGEERMADISVISSEANLQTDLMKFKKGVI